MKRKYLVLAATLWFSTTSSFGQTDKPWEQLDKRLTELFDKAVVSAPGAKLVEEMNDDKKMYFNRVGRLRQHGVLDKVTVMFDSDGSATPDVVGGAAVLVVAKQVHLNRLAFAHSLFRVQQFVQDSLWKQLTDQEKELINEWTALPEKERDRMSQTFVNLSDLAQRETVNQIARLTTKLDRDSKQVELLIQRGKLYAQIDAYAYLAWVDFARAIALNPMHKEAKEIGILRSRQRATLSE